MRVVCVGENSHGMCVVWVLGGERIRGLKWGLDGRIHACKTGERTRHDKK